MEKHYWCIYPYNYKDDPTATLETTTEPISSPTNNSTPSPTAKPTPVLLHHPKPTPTDFPTEHCQLRLYTPQGLPYTLSWFPLKYNHRQVFLNVDKSISACGRTNLVMLN